ncbi:hypothetical protein V6R21_10055 [Limibacter armeniacum]|uniref:hypothetical protein n=1 Tax=Limibacter armeniacum TaxID=466084 RepID=UPI002FE68296
MKLSILKIQLICILGSILYSHSINAQVSEDSDLFRVLKEKDSLMFDVGFNECNLDQIESLLPEHFEFYHDKDGITNTRIAFIQTLKENLCSSGKNTTKRILEQGSMEVFPLYNNGVLYGAIQTGRHSFGSVEARFTNLWLLENDEWKPFRMISYDHKMKESAVISDVTFIKLSSDEIPAYLGQYKFSSDFTLSVIQEGNKLYGDAQGQKVEIKPYEKHKFLDQSQTMKLTFVTDTSGAISGLQIQGPNGIMMGEKIN